jgi:NSS family neurotransmitter:Na+ symporter
LAWQHLGFPYKMGKNGGFAFLLVYLILSFSSGRRYMLGELTLGRKSGRGAVGTYVYFAKK